MKPLIKKLLFTLLLLNAICYAGQIKNLVIYFGKDKAYITNGEAVKLAALKSADYVKLTGHTDNDGTDGYNIGLSKKRVDAVKAYIQNMDKGIKIETDYFGERRPVNHNANEQEKTLNRRVEITYVSDPVLRIPVPEQQFVVDNSCDKVITCQHGTEVHIPAGAFGNEKVTINVSEYYQPDEIFAANLSTRSNKVPIETAGMIYITAEANGVVVEPSQPLEYKFPRKNMSKDFKIFSGVRDSSFNMNWVLDNPGQPAVEPQASQANRLNKNEADTIVVDTGVLSIVDVNDNYYSALFTANYDDRIVEDFFQRLDTMDRTRYNEYLKNSKIDIAVRADGIITSVKDSCASKAGDCEEQIQRFIRSVLPPKFNPYCCNTYIHLDFSIADNDYVAFNQNTVPMINDNTLFMTLADAKYEADKIVLKTPTLGWINCDRFLSTTRLVNYTIQSDKDATIRAVVKKYKSFFVNEYWNNEDRAANNANTGKYVFYRIPDNEDVILISTKKVDGVTYFAIENSKTSDKGATINFNYKAVTPKQLAEAMKNLKI